MLSLVLVIKRLFITQSSRTRLFYNTGKRFFKFSTQTWINICWMKFFLDLRYVCRHPLILQTNLNNNSKRTVFWFWFSQLFFHLIIFTSYPILRKKLSLNQTHMYEVDQNKSVASIAKENWQTFYRRSYHPLENSRTRYSK